ncbi:MAG: TM2 domain-containing protein [Coriobacteriales bacterium]|nr:TM2 domain-containing protein [Coriobacteriales bacterium]
MSTKKINALAYLLFCFFLGVIGVHRFYRGSIGMDVLYIFTLGLLGIGVLIDFINAIIYLTQADENQEITFVNKKYAKIQR